jgi:hypothetical protein
VSEEHKAMLHVTLDVRDQESALPPGFHDGVFLLRFQEIGGENPSLRVLRGGLDQEKISWEIVREPAIELRLQIPWEVLGEKRPAPGAAIGFEFTMLALGVWASWCPKVEGATRPRLGTLFFQE